VAPPGCCRVEPERRSLSYVPGGGVPRQSSMAWVRELLGLPEGTVGSFVSGATMANTTCLAADARVLTRAGWDAASLGLVGSSAIQVVVRPGGAHLGQQGLAWSVSGGTGCCACR